MQHLLRDPTDASAPPAMSRACWRLRHQFGVGDHLIANLTRLAELTAAKVEQAEARNRDWRTAVKAPPEPTYLQFLHIPKNGGTSINLLMRQSHLHVGDRSKYLPHGNCSAARFNSHCTLNVGCLCSP